MFKQAGGSPLPLALPLPPNFPSPCWHTPGWPSLLLPAGNARAGALPAASLSPRKGDAEDAVLALPLLLREMSADSFPNYPGSATGKRWKSKVQFVTAGPVATPIKWVFWGISQESCSHPASPPRAVELYLQRLWHWHSGRMSWSQGAGTEREIEQGY